MTNKVPYHPIKDLIQQISRLQVQAMSESKDKSKTMCYFQKQGSFSLQCGMHCINNLFKKQVYSIKAMQEICYQLSDDFINPHKHVLGGDYDANVIIMALQMQGYECEWIDKRKQIKVDNYLLNMANTKETLGFLVNIPMPKKLYHHIMRFSSRHWYSVRFSASKKEFQLCDSLEQQIKTIPNQVELQKYFKNVVKQEGEIFWVYKPVKQT